MNFPSAPVMVCLAGCLDVCVGPAPISPAPPRLHRRGDNAPMNTSVDPAVDLGMVWRNRFATLGEAFFTLQQPTPLPSPVWVGTSPSVARLLGLEPQWLACPAGLGAFTGNLPIAGTQPLASVYSGHQFGHWAGQLGDGRALLLVDVIDQQGRQRDIQLKGSGRTPFSRGGDGRSPLGPALREYILCEAMYALGVPTTRALAVVSSGEQVVREQPEPGAVFTRVAASHIRVGTLQLFALRQNEQALRALADHVLERHYPHLDRTADDRYVQLFAAICRRQAELIAQWLLLGFIHGVMNTDNMTLSGETIDYGPCAFMDAFKAGQVFSSIDQRGRYAYQNQPAIGQWNLARLAEAMLSLFPGDEDAAIQQATAILKDYNNIHSQAWEQGMVRKLGFSSVVAGDVQRIAGLLELLEQGALDYTLFFRRLGQVTQPNADRSPVLSLLNLPDCRNNAALERALHEWLDEWQQQLAQRETESADVITRMQSVNPAIIPRNHRVAEAIEAAENDDFSVFETLLSALEQPYAEQAAFEHYQLPPEPEQKVLRTFCGT